LDLRLGEWMKMDWVKILGNTGISFFSTLVSLLTFDALANVEMPIHAFICIAFFVSLIQGGLTFCKEIVKTRNGIGTKGFSAMRKVRDKKTYNLLDKITLF